MDQMQSEKHVELDEQVLQVEVAVAKLLRVGTAIASLLIAAGLAILLFQLPYTLGPTLITAGLIALVCTPLLRVAAALLIYLKLGDFTYSIISLTVLAIVSIGILLGEIH